MVHSVPSKGAVFLLARALLTATLIILLPTGKTAMMRGVKGLKTGTTAGAGACLCTLVCRGNRAVVVVVCGSRSSKDRYTAMSLTRH